MKLSRSLPSSLVAYDEKWPGTRSQAMMEADQHLKAMYRLHRTGKFMRKLTKEDRTQVRVWGSWKLWYIIEDNICLIINSCLKDFICGSRIVRKMYNFIYV